MLLVFIGLTCTGMDLNGKIAEFQFGKTMVPITNVKTGKVFQQHDPKGTIGFGASMQSNFAAIAMHKPYQAVHVMDLVAGTVTYRFIPPNGGNVRVALGRYKLTLAVGTSTGILHGSVIALTFSGHAYILTHTKEGQYQLIHALKACKTQIRSVVLNCDSSILAILCFNEGKVSLWDVEQGVYALPSTFIS